MPVEKKVQASTAAAAVSGLALWSLGHYVFKGTVPDVVASWVYVLVPGVITFAAGYLAKHTPRPVPAVGPITPMQAPMSEAQAAEFRRQLAASLTAPPDLRGLVPSAAAEPEPPAATQPEAM